MSAWPWFNAAVDEYLASLISDGLPHKMLPKHFRLLNCSSTLLVVMSTFVMIDKNESEG